MEKVDPLLKARTNYFELQNLVVDYTGLFHHNRRDVFLKSMRVSLTSCLCLLDFKALALCGLALCNKKNYRYPQENQNNVHEIESLFDSYPHDDSNICSLKFYSVGKILKV